MAAGSSESDALMSDMSAAKDVCTDSDSGSALDEYETQYFGFTPKSFCNGFYNAVNEYFLDSLSLLEDQSNRKFSEVAVTNQVQEGINAIKPILARHIDRAFDTLEAYLFTNIFCIPAHVVLPEDSVQEDGTGSPQELQRLDKSILEIKDKLLAVKCANATLQCEHQEGKRVQGLLSVAVDEFKQIQEQLLTAGVPDVQDYIAHNSAQAEKLLHLLSATSKLLRSQKEVDESTEPQAKILKSS